MNLAEPSVTAFRGELARAVDELAEVAGQPAGGDENAPALLPQAFERLFDAMQRTEAGVTAQPPAQSRGPAGAEAVTELGEYAIELFEQAMLWAKRLDLPDVHLTLQAFVIAMGRWIARHGGEILALEPIVDALAGTANTLHDQRLLATLYAIMGEIMDATAETIRRDLEKTNPGRPWRILHLNRAIVATRTHQPDIMEDAFSILIRDLPEDAPRFFSEGMQQMDLLNYPAHVKGVMDRYYRKWSVGRSLH